MEGGARAAADTVGGAAERAKETASEAAERVRGAAGEVANKAEGAYQQAREAVGEAASKAGDKAGEAKEAVKAKADEAGAAVQGAATRAGDKAEEAKDAAADKAQGAKESTGERHGVVGFLVSGGSDELGKQELLSFRPACLSHGSHASLWHAESTILPLFWGLRLQMRQGSMPPGCSARRASVLRTLRTLWATPCRHVANSKCWLSGHTTRKSRACCGRCALARVPWLIPCTSLPPCALVLPPAGCRGQGQVGVPAHQG